MIEPPIAMAPDSPQDSQPPRAGDPAPAATPRPSIAAEIQASALQIAPPLTLLTALAAIADLLVNRVAILGLADRYEATVLLEWAKWGELPRNLAAVSGLVVLLFSMGTYLGMRGFAPIHLRLPIAGFAGVLMPSITFATFTPKERLLGHLVLFGMFAANVLTCLLALTAMPYRNRALRAGLGLAFATGLQALVLMTIVSIRAVVTSDFGWNAAWVARHLGELTWFLTPFALSGALIRQLHGAREWLAAAAGASTFVFGAALVGWAEQHVHPEFSVVMYGLFRLAALPEPWVGVYGMLAALALGLGVFGMTNPDPWKRQLGGALILWTVAGHSPRTPIQLLYQVLAILLMARVAQAADPLGVERSLRSWRTRSKRSS